MTKVIRCTGPANIVKDANEYTKEDALRDSWDYWERRDLTHPEKQNSKLIPELKRKGR